MIFTVIVLVDNKREEQLRVETSGRDEAIKYAIRTYNDYLNVGFIKSYQIKGVI